MKLTQTNAPARATGRKHPVAARICPKGLVQHARSLHQLVQGVAASAKGGLLASSGLLQTSTASKRTVIAQASDRVQSSAEAVIKASAGGLKEAGFDPGGWVTYPGSDPMPCRSLAWEVVAPMQ